LGGQAIGFRVIVFTITELAKHYKDDNQLFEKVYRYCTVAYTVSTGIWKGSSSMKRDLRDIRKQFRLTDAEEKQILDLMREKG
jgi:hypothetical protein